MFPADHIGNALRDGLQQPLQRLLLSSPTAAAFAQDAASLSPRVLVRHTAEHVFRIRMFRSLDADATRRMQSASPDIAEIWARYARSEAVHDRYFLRDLGALGVGRETVEALSPFAATGRLGAFIEHAMAVYGPLPVVLYSFWAEQNSDVGSSAVIASARAAFGSEAVRGASAHRALDDGQDHPALINRVLAGLIHDETELLLALSLLEAITGFIQQYFQELDEWSRSDEPDVTAMAASIERLAVQAAAADNAAR